MPERIGKAETIKQMIRLPTSIIGLLDEIIEESKVYSTKPDFIIYSMRTYLSLILDAYSEIIMGKLKPNNTDDDLLKLKEVIDDPELLTQLFTKNRIGIVSTMDDASLIGKKTDPIMVYIPIGMAEEIEYVMKKTKIANKLNDFIKQSISFNLSKHYYHDSMLELSYIEDEKGVYGFENLDRISASLRAAEISAYGSQTEQDRKIIQYFLKQHLRKLD